ncbi:large ribosomal subunit protein mL101 (rPPR4) isoform X2 [Elaeis guineensis]|uniref:Pentatricopeptide repeat-containing protein At1g60770 isoform X2 n=1 Tax=Elaeis guineensis var. tenera TaxID=51953 RepID=A0A6J0PKU6_ELAGV|nr:pentatricopeptide repeat-containing protein At1g60770 isoform X2 [Elaeis guineensis]XP_029120997.1 pentatricopeptide repeat-containing protein At1g60770 isoform X2 [Elaeis guineensis]
MLAGTYCVRLILQLLSETMARRGMNLTVSDQAIRLDLVAKARGVASAEEYFINLPEPAKHHLTYGALLNCYCKELMPDKAEALMEKMKELKFASSPMAYNSLMTLYTKTNQPEKVPSIIQEMKTNDVLPDCYTYNVWMRALAAINDISSVERVIEEMKRDGRVTADWTTYSNLASIFVDAGMFQKAEEALKELEKRNMDNDLRAYQFLITLYGRTGNLVEVHRIWRFLKLAHPKMANISYLNMIQVLVNLKDLPGAEACFKDWESKCSTYDIRVANAMIRAYAKEGMLDKAEAVKKRAKMRGARLNAKTWEIFMEYYLNKGDMKMAHWCADRAIKKGRSHGRIWVPPREVIRAIMAYFEENKDVAGAENFIELLQKVVNDLEAEVFEALVRTYAAAGKNSPGMRRRLKMENAVVSEATEKLLDIVCVE